MWVNRWMGKREIVLFQDGREDFGSVQGGVFHMRVVSMYLGDDYSRYVDPGVAARDNGIGPMF